MSIFALLRFGRLLKAAHRLPGVRAVAVTSRPHCLVESMRAEAFLHFGDHHCLHADGTTLANALEKAITKAREEVTQDVADDQVA